MTRGESLWHKTFNCALTEIVVSKILYGTGCSTTAARDEAQLNVGKCSTRVPLSSRRVIECDRQLGGDGGCGKSRAVGSEAKQQLLQLKRPSSVTGTPKEIQPYKPGA